MTVKEILVQDLGLVLEETGNIMVDKMVLESLAKNGNVSLEEAEFYNTLVRRVVEEAAEEFVPDSLPEPEMVEPADESENMVLTGEDGTVYNFNPGTCELVPVEGTGGADDDAAALENPGEGVVAEEELQEPVLESTEETKEIVEEAEVVEEASASEADVETEVELTESQQIVSNLIKSLGA